MSSAAEASRDGLDRTATDFLDSAQRGLTTAGNRNGSMTRAVIVLLLLIANALVAAHKRETTAPPPPEMKVAQVAMFRTPPACRLEERAAL